MHMALTVHLLKNGLYSVGNEEKLLLFMYKTHMEIAINNNDLTKFEKEWGQFLPLVNSIDA